MEKINEATLEQSRALARLLLDIHQQDRKDLIALTDAAKRISAVALTASVVAIAVLIIRRGGDG